MTIKKVISSGLYPVKIWTVDVDDKSIDQLTLASQMPFIHKHIAAMPDVHLGIGATIGSVIPTKGAIIPAAVGVDLGCGMMAVRTSLTANDLPDNLKDLRKKIERAVPHGGPGKIGSWEELGRYGVPAAISSMWAYNLQTRWERVIAKAPKVEKGFSITQLGTLGGGNHFIEICLDEMNDLWVMLHSGSRGVGNRIGRYYIEAAKEEMRRYHIFNQLPHRDLAYVVEKTEVFDDYCFAVLWAQDFARLNREAMMERVLSVLRDTFKPFTMDKKAINCHHNYISRENHFGQNVWVTRKGAIRAREGDLGIIPGSMGAKSFIVMGKGEKESFTSCSHGAGRIMSRTEAKKRFTVEDLAKQTAGVECPVDADRVDEIPSAYKDIDQVMANQSDLVAVLHTLRQVVNVKG